MAKKTYRTFSLKGLQVCFKDPEGRRIEVIFRGGIQIDSTARYSTSDVYIQERLESSSGFGRDYYIESSVEPAAPAPLPERKAEEPKKAEPKKEIMSEVKGSERFRNLVEMRNRMAELGIEVPENANYPTAKAAAAKAGYDFQIKK